MGCPTRDRIKIPLRVLRPYPAGHSQPTLASTPGEPASHLLPGPPPMSQRLHRRRFLQTTAASGLGYWLAAPALSAQRAANKPNETIHIAGVGVGGKGSSDIDQAGEVGEIVAICDIDDHHVNAKTKKFPSAKHYYDFRKMFDEMAKQIDAVTVSTPDHTHAPASIMAMKLRKHVYCQKPLTHTVHEARMMRETAKQM